MCSMSKEISFSSPRMSFYGSLIIKQSSHHFTFSTCRLNLVFLTFILHGIGTLMPWNMFITAKDVSSALIFQTHGVYLCLISALKVHPCLLLICYVSFQYFVVYKLSNNGKAVDSYAANFLPYLGFASQIPNVIFNWLNIFVQIG